MSKIVDLLDKLTEKIWTSKDYPPQGREVDANPSQGAPYHSRCGAPPHRYLTGLDTGW